MRNVYVVTHPEATHHTDGLVGGWYDSSLTSRGLQDVHSIAAAVGELVAADHDVSLFSSDLLRTRQTAEAIAEHVGVGVAVDPKLRERSYGVADGVPAGSMHHVPPPARGERMRHRDGVVGSETRRMWASRVYAALDNVIVEGGRNSVVVTHGGTATYLIAAWIGLPIEAAGYVKFRMSPGGITHLREDDFFHDRQVVTLNALGHLGT